MSHLKRTGACALALLLIATSASAGQKTRTKSNNSNDRTAAEGVVPQDSAVGANACSTGAGQWSWAVSSVSGLAGGGSGAAAASYARMADAQADIGTVCDAVQSAIDRINADASALAAMDAAVEAGDTAAIQTLLLGNGLSAQLVPGAQFHAINTKGTGATNHRAVPGVDGGPAADGVQDATTPAGQRKADNTMPSRISMNVTVARVGGALSVSVGRHQHKTGHVTLNR